MAHLFVVQSDITQVQCDVWVMPVGSRLNFPKQFFSHYPHQQWLKNYSKAKGIQLNRNISRFSDLDECDYPTLNIKQKNLIAALEHDIPNYPKIYGLQVGMGLFFTKEESPHVANILVLLNILKTDLQNIKPLNKREKPLIALPVFGTGGGGFASSTGSAIKMYLETIQHYLENNDEFDVLLCVYDRASLIAAQKVRETHIKKYFNLFVSSPPVEIPNNVDIFEYVNEIAKLLLEDRLVIFLGHDTNKELGIPSKEEMLNKIGENLNINIINSSWNEADLLSKAEIIQKRCLKQGESIGKLFVEELKSCRFSLKHALIGGLNCSSVVTTNYDKCYENVSDVLKFDLSVIPVDIKKTSKNWLLKLNGCVSDPESIIATRQDLLRYMETNSALAGIVQAKLLTSHLLFDGFSLDDETFHQIMDSVVKRKKKFSQNDCVGTSLQHLCNPYTSEIWNPLIQCVSMKQISSTSSPVKSLKKAAFRQTEIFFDLLLLRHTTFDCAYILDNRFTHILTKEEQLLNYSLEKFSNKLTTLPPDILSKWSKINNTLTQYGWCGHATNRNIRVCYKGFACGDYYCNKIHPKNRNICCTYENCEIKKCPFLHPYASESIPYDGDITWDSVCLIINKLSLDTSTRRFSLKRGAIRVYGDNCHTIAKLLSRRIIRCSRITNKKILISNEIYDFLNNSSDSLQHIFGINDFVDISLDSNSPKSLHIVSKSSVCREVNKICAWIANHNAKI